MPHSHAEHEALENLMDKMGVEGLLSALSVICSEKAAHVQEAWQDSHLARRWERLGNKFKTLSTSLDDPYYQKP